MRTYPAAVAAVAVLTAGCGSASTGPTPRSAPTHQQLHAVRVDMKVQRALAASDAAFARSLWTKLSASDGNVVLSPASIATALQMAYVGAHGTTAAEMARTMHLGTDASAADIAAAAGALISQLELASTKDAQVNLADEVWLQRDFPVVPGYRDALSSDFSSAFNLADFIRHGDEARESINAAIATQTHDRIHDLIPPGTDLSDTRLILTNAIYLKAAWAAPFEASETAPAAFTRADGRIVHPKTMKTTSDLDYAATGDYQAVRLPYADGRLTMTLLLPAAGRPMAWPATAPHFQSQTVQLALPKFRFSWGTDLAELLRGLGMATAFSGTADFSGMSPKPLHIGAVRHKAFIAVDENGTEAAAATDVEMRVGAAAPPSSITPLRLDRPFLFRIDDTSTGLPLFLGKVADPTLGA